MLTSLASFRGGPLPHPHPFPPSSAQGYYVNLLKTISLKLNETTVQFFFHAGGPPGGGRGTGGASPGAARPAAFPLYTESIKFVNHRWVGGRPPWGHAASGGCGQGR